MSSSKVKAKKNKPISLKKYKREKVESVRYFDYGLLMMVVLLLGFGLLMLYSSSSYDAALGHGDPAYYLKKQVVAVGVGFVGMFIATIINYHFFEKISVILYLISIVLCIAVIFIGSSGGGSSRWFRIGGVSFQPSEACKVAVIVFLASMLYRYKDQIKDWVFIVKLFLFVIPAFVIVAINNLSTAVIIFAIAYIMLFIASKNYLIFGGIAAFGVMAILLFISFAGYRSDRIEIWMDPAGHPRGGQVIQGLYAIGSGGLFGKGLGESIQKQGFVPEAQNDMIFSIICEELGIMGAICVIVMYILLIWRLLVIALNAKDMFGSFMVIGIIAHISIQVILNIAVVTNTIPNTGVTLPFISYGGTSVSILIGEMGLALGVSRGIYLK